MTQLIVVCIRNESPHIQNHFLLGHRWPHIVTGWINDFGWTVPHLPNPVSGVLRDCHNDRIGIDFTFDTDVGHLFLNRRRLAFSWTIPQSRPEKPLPGMREHTHENSARSRTSQTTGVAVIDE